MNLKFWKPRNRAWEQRRREFVYLDEVSVTSLVAARHGSIAESFKNTHSETSGAQVGSSLTVPATPLTPGANLTSRMTSSRTTTQEVVRRAVVQGTFRSLRITDTDLKLSVEDRQPENKPPPATTEAELTKALTKLAKQRRAVRVTDLKRGDVIELRVQLSADPTYQFAAAASSMLDLIKGRSAMFGIDEQQFADIAPMLELLPQMLVDLVPLNAKVISHRRIDLDDESWLVDTTMLTPGSSLAAVAETIAIVGVTEIPLYWKDARRVLFDNAEYTVYTRLAKPGLATTWTPIKLADVFDTLDPKIGKDFRELPNGFKNLHKAGVEVLAVPFVEIFATEGLIPFGHALAQQTGRILDEDKLTSTAHEAAQAINDLDSLGDISATRSAFEHIVAAVEASPPLLLTPIDRNLVAALREPHQALAQLSATVPALQTAIEEPEETTHDRKLLEVEFVAIYW
ncbi:DUF6414 family protein [Nocardioides lianchengensis]|uniref:Uncharacterized protein n=1 Tax=Nocardioides lianchengensis TaxID=1045774 RepID=A0A1G6Q9R7_9ACTN|nr:hypothetical protein [Nocardioides lianchengensis]NYG12126.1 hypothetical protein [Nocardioides lianchengensis]SDC88407.1 hypothetical protein SAMN05421872_104298 [Nocardioides lianchengensis]